MALPDLPAGQTIIIFDGDCVLCSFSARFVAKRDRADQFRFATAQSALGQALYHHFDRDAVDFDTALVVTADGKLHEKADAIQTVLTRLGGIWLAARLIGWVPRPLRNWVYDRVARNRYGLFGKQDLCALPDPRVQARLIGLD